MRMDIYITGRISRFANKWTRYSLDVIESEAKLSIGNIALSDDNSIFILSPKEEDEEIERRQRRL